MSCRRRAKLGFAVLCGLFGGGALFAQSVIRQGVEFQVNRITFLSQYAPAVARDADGDFVVTWTDGTIESGPGIFGLRFNSAGDILGSQFHVNTHTPSIQDYSSVAMESNGDFVVVWNSFSQTFLSTYAIFGQRFTSAGATVGVEFQVNSSTFYAFQPRIASDADGDFVVAWQSLFFDPNTAVVARRFNSSGSALGAEFMLNTFTTQKQGNPGVAADADGDFVVVWESFGSQDGQAYGIFGRRFNSLGTPQGAEFQANSYTLESQRAPAVAADADGDFVVTWMSLHQDGVFPYGNLGVFARRFTSSGVGQAIEFMVNVRTLSYQRAPEIAGDDSGDFVVTWTSSDGTPTAEMGVFARRVGSAAIGTEFQVNTYTVNGQGEVNGTGLHAIDFDADGDFVIAWTTQEPQDGNADGVFLQRFSLPPLAVLDIDGNGVVDPLTDGLLNLRRRFGFTGASLTTGATALNCTRCSPVDVQTYIDGLGLTLDVYDNGTLEPLSDGVLILRFMFHFTGTTLTSGALGSGCSARCDAAAILAFLQTLD